MFVFGIKENVIVGEWRKYGLEKCIILEKRNGIYIWREIGVFVYKG